MIKKLKDWVMGMLVQKYALGSLVEAYKLAKGYKTQASLILAIATFLGEVFCGLDQELAVQIYAFLGGIGSLSFVQKLKGYQDKIKKIADKVKVEANKPVKAGE